MQPFTVIAHFAESKFKIGADEILSLAFCDTFGTRGVPGRRPWRERFRGILLFFMPQHAAFLGTHTKFLILVAHGHSLGVVRMQESAVFTFLTAIFDPVITHLGAKGGLVDLPVQRVYICLLLSKRH